MMLLSRKTDYALLIFSYLRDRPEGGSAREIAEGYNLSRGFVANILKALCHKGLLTSHRGVKGGYVLQRPVERIYLAEVMDALEEPFHLAECTKVAPGDGCAVMPLCPVRGGIAGLHRRIREMLRNVTLAELLRPEHAQASTEYGLELSYSHGLS